MRNSTSIFKKITAGIFSLLLLVVYAEKAIHTHPVNEAVDFGITHTTVSASCSICDFQLARDIEVPVQPGLEASISFYQEPFPVIHCTHHAAPLTTPAKRGPPAI